MSQYEVPLERARDSEGHLGSFGLSILGGYGTKFPAVVCEVDPGGAADRTGIVKVGDRLTNLNGEDLCELTPKDLVSKIRTAPSPSIFALVKDEELRQQVVKLLRKQEMRAAAKRNKASAAGSAETSDKVTAHKKVSATTSNSGTSKDRKKVMSKIIEVEPSVNVNDGRSGDIVRVYHNQIIGKLDPTVEMDSDREVSPMRGGRHVSPRQVSPAVSVQSSESGDSKSVSRGLNDDTTKARLRSTASPEIQATPSPEHTTQDTTQSSHNTTQSSQDTTQSSQDTTQSSQDTTQDSVVLVRVKGGDDSAIVSDSGDLESSTATASPREQDSGVALKIPSWNGPAGSDNRASLSEAVLIEELEKVTPTQNSTPPMGGSKEQDEERAESVESQSSGSPGHVPESPGRSPFMDPDKREELMKKYRSTPTRTSSKRKEDPFTQAVSLARRLYMLDGFKKSEVAEKLAQPSEFGQTVAKEYLRFFEFERLSLDESLRQFLSSFLLTGESQERERIMVHFSERFFSANPDSFPSVDTVHGLTIALLLLNTDLHSDHGSRKMSFSQFVTSLERIGVKLPKDILRKYYNNIRKKPLEWATEEEEDDPIVNHTNEEEETVRMYHVTIPGTFVEVELPGNALLFKEGFVLRKNIMEGPHKKVARGKRTWKPFYAYLKGFLLYFGEPQGELHLEDTRSAISVCHCLAMGAFDYNKKNSVLRVTTSDWHSFLLQASNVTDMQQWIGAINKASALYSSAPLAAPMSSSLTFVRPTFPLAPTKNTLEQQIESHEARIKSLEKEMEEHQAYKPTGSKAKHSLLQVWFDKYEFLQYQMNCFRIYYASLTTNELINFNAPLPSGLVPSPSVSTLAVTGTSYDLDLRVRDAHTPPHSPSSQRKSSHVEFRDSQLPDSPLARKKGGKR